MITYFLVGFASLVTVTALLRERVRKLLMLIGRFFVHFALIGFEHRIWHNMLKMPGPLPRNLGEVFDNPARFERLLKKNKVLAEDEEIIELQHLAAISTEPDKQATAGSLKVVIGRKGTPSRDLCLFCKFQTGRGMPLWLQAIRAAAEPGVCREIDFYAQVSQSVPVRTLKPYLTLKYPALNYVLLALEYVDLERKQARVVNDYMSATVSEVQKMMVEVAKMHAKFLDAGEPEISWIPAKRGLQYAQFVESFTSKGEKIWSLAIWKALNKYFADKPVTLVHGDCRPGNMMFEGTDRDHVSGLIFADWEATNVGPLLWDLTYCTTLGWNGRSRKKHLDEIIDAYLDSLASEASCAQAAFPTRDEAKLDVAVLTLVLGFVSRTVRLNHFWAKQGNTSKDTIAWFVRVANTIGDLDEEKVAQAIGVDTADIKRMKEQAKSEVLEANLISTQDWDDI